jgi:cell division protein FtsQ
MNAAPVSLRRRIITATAATLAVVALAGGAWYAFGAISSQPIERISFAGDMNRIAPGDLENFAHSMQGEAGVSLEAVREAAKKIPWVRDATARRRFPDAVEVTFQVHEPLARWNDSALVSTRGDVFAAEFDGPLPRFRGRDGSASLMANEYPAIVKTVAPFPAVVVQLSLSPRGAWEVVLDSGLVLELGRDDIESRLARFAQAWPSVSAHALESRHADLRYANGFALTRVADLKPQKKKTPR